MPDLFSSGPGRVVQLVGPTLPMSIRITSGHNNNLYDQWRGFTGFKSIITGLSINGQSGYQILHTLNQFLYIYSFGERAADLTITGLSFLANCHDPLSAGGWLAVPTGLDHLINFYRRNRLSWRGAPLAITIGAFTTLYGFLVAMRADMNDTVSGISQFSLAFKCPPF
jgi:hypothetical protein